MQFECFFENGTLLCLLKGSKWFASKVKLHGTFCFAGKNILKPTSIQLRCAAVQHERVSKNQNLLLKSEIKTVKIINNEFMQSVVQM